MSNKLVKASQLQEVVNALNKKNSLRNEEINNKVKINDVGVQNVNFIQNKAVQDGLVSSLDECGRVCTMIANVTMSKLINGDTSIYSKHKGTTGWKLYIPANTMNIYIGRHFENTQEWTKLDDFKGFGDTKKIIIIDNGKRASVSIDGVTVREFEYTDSIKELNTSIYVEFINKLIYNRPLTPQEIQHNLSVLSNTPSISSIETPDKTSLLLATKSDLVETRTGHTDEERYTALLGKFGKKFTSTSENITVDNGIEKQRVLSGKIEGQTVKNYARMSSSYGDLQNFTLQGLWGNQYNFEDVGLEANKSYYVTINIKEFNSSANLDLYIRVRGIKDVKLGQITKTGIYTFAFNTGTQDATPPKLSHLRCSLGTSTDNLLVSWFVLTDKDVQISNCFSGLCSTEAILTNNGIKYPFYKSLEDKQNGKVIELPKLENGVGNTLEMLEDGSAILTENFGKSLITSDSGFRIADFGTNFDDSVVFLFATKATPDVASGYVSTLADTLRMYDGSTEVLEKNVTGGYVYNNALRVRVVGITTVEELKAYLQVNPITIIYPLATPIVTHIQKELCPAIATEQTNIFSVDSAVKPSGLEVTVAVQDPTKEYTLTPQNGWTNSGGNYPTLQGCLSKDNKVRIVGRISNTGTNSQITTLPDELRPNKTIVDGIYTITSAGVVTSATQTGTLDVNIEYRKVMI